MSNKGVESGGASAPQEPVNPADVVGAAMEGVDAGVDAGREGVTQAAEASKADDKEVIKDAEPEVEDAVDAAKDAARKVEALGGDATELIRQSEVFQRGLEAVRSFGESSTVQEAMRVLSMLEGLPEAEAQLQVTLTEEVVAVAVELQERYQNHVQVAVEEGGVTLSDDPATRAQEIGQLQAELGLEGDAVDGVMGPQTLTLLLTREYSREGGVIEGELNDTYISNLEQERDIIATQEGVILDQAEREARGIELETARTRQLEDQAELVGLTRQITVVTEDAGLLRTIDEEFASLDSSQSQLEVNLAKTKAIIEELEGVYGPLSVEATVQLESARDRRVQIVGLLNDVSGRRAELNARRDDIIRRNELTKGATNDEMILALTDKRDEMIERRGVLNNDIAERAQRIQELSSSLKIDPAVMQRLEAIQSLIDAGLTREVVITTYEALEAGTMTPAQIPGGLTQEQITEAYNSIMEAARQRAEERAAQVQRTRGSRRSSGGSSSGGSSRRSAPAEAAEAVEGVTEAMITDFEIQKEHFETRLANVSSMLREAQEARAQGNLPESNRFANEAQSEYLLARGVLGNINEMYQEHGHDLVGGDFGDWFSSQQQELDSLQTATVQLLSANAEASPETE